MTRIIDLGNGYGRVEGYTSEYASLTFPLTRTGILRLYVMGVISQNETREALLSLGCEWAAIEWAIAVSSVSTEQWKARLERARTI